MLGYFLWAASALILSKLALDWPHASSKTFDMFVLIFISCRCCSFLRSINKLFLNIFNSISICIQIIHHYMIGPVYFIETIYLVEKTKNKQKKPKANINKTKIHLLILKSMSWFSLTLKRSNLISLWQDFHRWNGESMRMQCIFKYLYKRT